MDGMNGMMGEWGAYGPPDVLPAGYGETKNEPGQQGNLGRLGVGPAMPDPGTVVDPVSRTPFNRGSANIGVSNAGAAPGWGTETPIGGFGTPAYLNDGVGATSATDDGKKGVKWQPRDVAAPDGSGVYRQFPDGSILVLDSKPFKKLIGVTITQASHPKPWSQITAAIGAWVPPLLTAATSALTQGVSKEIDRARRPKVKKKVVFVPSPQSPGAILPPGVLPWWGWALVGVGTLSLVVMAVRAGRKGA